MPIATRAIHLVNEHAGVEVARVVPVSRIPKTTSGKLQRTALAKSFEDGEFAAELAEFDAAWQAAHGQAAPPPAIERQLKAIVDDALPGKHVDVDDNLFEVGASSLTLIQIHEKIDELYPGLVDLTELFDFPTVSQLAKHLEQKLPDSLRPAANTARSRASRQHGAGRDRLTPPYPLIACAAASSACATTTSRRGRRGSRLPALARSGPVISPCGSLSPGSLQRLERHLVAAARQSPHPRRCSTCAAQRSGEQLRPHVERGVLAEELASSASPALVVGAWSATRPIAAHVATAREFPQHRLRRYQPRTEARAHAAKPARPRVGCGSACRGPTSRRTELQRHALQDPLRVAVVRADEDRAVGRARLREQMRIRESRHARASASAPRRGV